VAQDQTSAIDFFFVDGSEQQRPSREGMGPLMAVGGLLVPGESVRALERGLDGLCQEFGFPPGQEFKWSPGRELWMREKLVDGARSTFFNSALILAAQHGAQALVVIEDTKHALAIAEAGDHEMDVVGMFLERANNQLTARNRHGVVVVDRPTGGRREETQYLVRCLEALQTGTKFVKPDRIAINVLTTASELVRLVQLADVVVSCSVSHVSGEQRFSPATFKFIRPLLCEGWLGSGGIGFKIHPDFNYANLYHWLLGDRRFRKRTMVFSLPMAGRPYGASADRWR